MGVSLLKEADRVADRLRTLLPRLLGRADDAPGRELLATSRATLQALADAGASAQGTAPRVVPDIRPHAVPDQVIVLTHDLVTGVPETDAFPTQAAAQAAHEDAMVRAEHALRDLRAAL